MLKGGWSRSPKGVGFLLERNEVMCLCQPPKRRGPASQGAGTWDGRLEDPEVDVHRAVEVGGR